MVKINGSGYEHWQPANYFAPDPHPYAASAFYPYVPHEIFSSSAPSVFYPTDSTPYAPSLPAPSDSYALPEAHDPLRDFFRGKRELSRWNVTEILQHIEARRQLKEESLKKIEEDRLGLRERVMRLDVWHPTMNTAADKLRMNLEREILALERERRFEKVAYWRDITRIESEFREAVGGYAQEQRRAGLLGDLGGDSGWS